MPDLVLKLTDAGVAKIAGAAGSAPTVIAQLGLTATAFDFAPTLTALPGEFKRLASVGGAPAGPNLVHLEAFDNLADVWTATGLALYLDDGTLFAALSAGQIVLSKASLAFALIALDVAFNADVAAAISFGELVFLNPPATEEARGIIEIATQAEANAGVDDQRAVTPAKGKAAVTTWLFEKPVRVGVTDVLGDLTILAGHDLRIESQTEGYPVSLVYNDRGSLAFASNGWERGLFDEAGTLHVKGRRQFPNQSTIAGEGNLRVWAGVPGGASYTSIDTLDYTPFEMMREINGVISRVGAITSTDFVTTYGTSSDYRLKEDLQPVTDALEQIMAIKVWDYRWIGTERRSISYVAHELGEIIPDAVIGKKDAVRQIEIQADPGKRRVLGEGGAIIDPGADPDVRIDTIPDYQNVDAGKVVPILHAALQELVTIVREQGEQIAALQSRRRKPRSAA